MIHVTSNIGFSSVIRLGLVAFLLLLIGCKRNSAETNENTKKGYDNSTTEEYKLQKEKTGSQNIASGNLANGWYQTTPDEMSIKRSHTNYSEPFALNPTPILSPRNCIKLIELTNYFEPLDFQFYLDPRGAKEWFSATYGNIGKHLVLILDNKIIGVTLVSKAETGGIAAFEAEDLDEKEIERIEAMIGCQRE